MNIAKDKKENNISEYIIHMYQTEDLLRSYNFDIDQIEKNVIKDIPQDQQEKDSLKNWYSEIAKKMKVEGIKEKGHLSEVQEIVQELSSLHIELLKSDKSYREIYDQAKLSINKNMEFSQGQITDPIQICLNGIYGLLLLRLEGKQVSEEQMDAVTKFGDVLSYLSYKYKKRKSKIEENKS